MDNNSNNNYHKDNNQAGAWYNEYPRPQVKDKPKRKKKKIFLRFIGFVLGALVFGLISGAGAAGYHYYFEGGQGNKMVVIEDDDLESVDESIIELSDDKNHSLASTRTEGIITDVSDVVEKVMPSIVSINSTDVITQYDIFFGRQFNQPVVGSGSGIIIGQSESSILIVTNNHVVEKAEDIEVVLFDDSKVKATIKGTDSRSDLAILEVEITDLSKDTLKEIKVARLGDSGQLRAGEMVIAIGNALGYGQSVTVGYVSALDREINIQGIKMNLLQTDAAINPGNSGGALINIKGEVIGINSLKFADTLVEGMGYSIPISDAIPMINMLTSNKAVEATEMGFLGINVQTAQNVTRDLANQFNMPIGIFINDVVEASPADQAGLRTGHIIVGLNDLKIETVEELLNILSYARPNEEITLRISELQNGEYVERDLSVTLSERP